MILLSSASYLTPWPKLVLPKLSYAYEVWGVSPSVGEAAEVLHRGFLKHLLGVRISTTNNIVLAEFGLPLQIHFWQQILRYHYRTVVLDDTRLVKLAMICGCTLSDDQAITATTNESWHFHLVCFLEHYTGHRHCVLLIFMLS